MRKDIQEIIAAAEKAGIKGYIGSPDKTEAQAESIRQNNIEFYSSPQKYMLNEIDAEFNLAAYQIMTSQEILMSEERYYETCRKGFEKHLADLRESDASARKTIIIGREKVA